MIHSIVVTVFPIVFLVIIFGGGEVLRRRHINQDGSSPINRAVFYTSKYLIMAVWLAIVLHHWGVNLAFFDVPPPLIYVSLILWILGFILLFTGRFSMGNSFRIGSPTENTGLRTGGLFRISRNPMYLGVFSTLLAAVLFTLNPLILLVVIFIIAVHHKIVLAEENYLQSVFGDEYRAYCNRVRRYI